VSFVISANRLKDGTVVYLTASDDWSEGLEDARIIEESELDDVQQVGREAETNNIVVGAYAVQVEQRENWQPKTLRERIRYLGPTIGNDRHRLLAVREG